MSTITPVKSQSETLNEIENFRQSTRIIHKIVRMNVEGLTQAESLIQPQPAGNCLNWVVGHLLAVYDLALPLVGEKPILPDGALKRYARGSLPLKEAAEARDLSELMSAWDRAIERIDTGLATLTVEALDKPTPSSPDNDPNETVRSLLNKICFHQAYHAGQTGMLRRIAGKERAIS
jgi:uncharacterized damage-inducible protein DinB